MFFSGFLLKTGCPHRQLGFRTNKTFKKFKKAPVSDWVPIKGDQKDVGLQTLMIRCHLGDTQRGLQIIFSQLICCDR